MVIRTETMRRLMTFGRNENCFVKYFFCATGTKKFFIHFYAAGWPKKLAYSGPPMKKCIARIATF